MTKKIRILILGSLRNRIERSEWSRDMYALIDREFEVTAPNPTGTGWYLVPGGWAVPPEHVRVLENKVEEYV